MSRCGAFCCDSVCRNIANGARCSIPFTSAITYDASGSIHKACATAIERAASKNLALRIEQLIPRTVDLIRWTGQGATCCFQLISASRPNAIAALKGATWLVQGANVALHGACSLLQGARSSVYGITSTRLGEAELACFLGENLSNRLAVLDLQSLSPRDLQTMRI
jgi:hypothetical protein